MTAGVCGGQIRGSDYLKLELRVIGNYVIREL